MRPVGVHLIRPGSRRRAGTLLTAGALLGVGFTVAAISADVAWAKDKFKVKVKNDTLTATGTDAGEPVTLRLNAGDAQILEIDVGDDGSAEFAAKRDTFVRIVVNAGGGNDVVRIDEVNGIFTDTEATTLDGEAGEDALVGGSGSETLIGGDGVDLVDGNRGDDLALLGADDDVFRWDPGDGSDTVEGQAGHDTLRFNGSGANEEFDLSANGGRVRFFRNVANITMDLNEIEQATVDALGGADALVVNDLSGTDLNEVKADLAGAAGGDGQADSVSIEGTTGGDTIVASGNASGIDVTGTAPDVSITGAEGANDTLEIDSLAGADAVDASGLDAGSIKLVLDGGTGADALTGSPGVDLVRGNGGDDVALLGASDDTFVWNPGDGSDTVEGQADHDTLLFNGSGASESFDVSANGGRVRFFRNVGSVTMDLNDIEQTEVHALGGSDAVVLHDLSGTDLIRVDADLAAPGGGGDGEADTVTVEGTAGDDAIVASGSAGTATVLGLAAFVHVADAEPASDTIEIDALAGDDAVDASGLAADAVKLVEDGGDGDDVLLGGSGDDVLHGGEGDDVLIGGPGFDVLDGGPGNNIVIQ